MLVSELIRRRTLSKRQRSLLEAYADDVEKQRSSTQTLKGSDNATKGSSQTSKSPEDPLSVDNGKAYFTHSPPFSGWLSKGWQNIRERFGF